MLKRLDAMEVNFVDSAARKEFKMSSSRGSGEARIYVGNDEEMLDEFFELDNITYFFARKDDLIQYLDNAKEEYDLPTQDYKSNITDMYLDLVKDTRNIDERITFSFRKTYDNQNRYFLVLTSGRDKYEYIRNICLPRVTQFLFIKFVNDTTGNKFIYLKPRFFNGIEEGVDPASQGKVKETNSKSTSSKNRPRQGEYRSKLLMEMPACIFTHVVDDRLLVACHIKPYKDCDNDDERYDYHNGITMTPTYHVLFDQGLISFEDNGKLLISPFLNNNTQKLLGIKQGDKKKLQSRSKIYLAYHRNNVFCKLPPNFVVEDSIDGQGYTITYVD